MNRLNVSSRYENSFNVARNEKPVYLNFAASKISNSVKPNTIVEFTDFTGRKHKVAVRNNTEMKKAMAFFAILKKESVMIKDIIASYPIKMGRVEKRFLPEVKRELKSLGLSKKHIDFVLA